MSKMTFTTSALPVTFSSKEKGGEIPENFATIASIVIAVASANGDLGWLGDMLHEAELRQARHYNRLTPAGVK